MSRAKRAAAHRKAAFARGWIDRLLDSAAVGVGPLSLDVTMARKHGWSPSQISRVVGQLGALSRRNHALSHRNGPPGNCPCVTCDPYAADALCEQQGQRQRAAWRKRNLFPYPPEGLS